MTSDAEKREAALARRRAYMRSYNGRDGTLSPKDVVGNAGHEQPFHLKTAKAIYVPGRDAPLQHEDLTASIMGDPPVGRRALDKPPGKR